MLPIPSVLLSAPLQSRLLVAMALLLGSCSAVPVLPVAVPDVVGRAENACLPEAILLAQTLKNSNVDAKILVVTTRSLSHATVVYQNPPGDPRVWVWDSDTQSTPVKADYNNAVAIARAWLDTNNVDDLVIKAAFL